jgi:integrase/recombinase XerD
MSLRRKNLVESVNNRLEDCPKKGSSMDKTFKKIPLGNNGNGEDYCGELRDMLLTMATNELSTMSKSEYITKEALIRSKLQSLFKDSEPSTKSHANTTIEILLSFLRRDLNDFTNLASIKLALAEIEKSNSFKRRRTILKTIYEFYFVAINAHALNPTRNLILDLIKSYGKESHEKKLFHSTRSEFHPLVNKFLEYLTEKNFKWQKRARLQLPYLIRWLTESGQIDSPNYAVDVTEISTDMLVAFKDHLQSRISTRELTTESAQTYIQTIKRWFRFLFINNYIFYDPSVRVTNFHVKKGRKFELVDLEVIATFFDAILSYQEDTLMWYSIFTLLATLGVRASEVLNLKLEDINFKRNTIKFLRKGGQEQILPLPTFTKTILELYIQSRYDPSLPFWYNKTRTMLSYNSLINQFHKFTKLANITENIVGCHYFRYLLFSELHLSGTKLETIKNLANHKKLQTLAIYLKGRDKTIKNDFQAKYRTVGVDLHDYGY